MHRASVFRRAAAAAIDSVIALVLFVVASAIAGSIADPRHGGEDRAAIAVFCLLWLLYALTEVFAAASLGKLAVGIRIARWDGEKPRDGRLLLRWMTKYYGAIPAIFDYFVPGTLMMSLGGMMNFLIFCGLLGVFNDDGLTWHDQWSGTCVIRRMRTIPEPRENSIRAASV